jgi:cytochrome c-type biogenesis protein CcmH
MMRYLPSAWHISRQSSFPRKRGSILLSAIHEKMDSRFRGNDGNAKGDAVRMRRRLRVVAAAACLLVAAFTLIAPAFAIDPLPFKDRAEEVRFQALTKQLRCLVCQNESLADSNAPLAADLRRDVFEQMQAGKSDEEIKAWLTARYSDFVLYDPPLDPATWLLWFGPALVLVAGAGVVVAVVRRRARNATAGAPPRTSDPGDDW